MTTHYRTYLRHMSLGCLLVLSVDLLYGYFPGVYPVGACMQLRGSEIWDKSICVIKSVGDTHYQYECQDPAAPWQFISKINSFREIEFSYTLVKCLD